MDSFHLLLERTRVPPPSLQKLSVISIFEKLRSSTVLDVPESDPGAHAVAQCLSSKSPAVVDQLVRELCLLVKDYKLEDSRGLLELQSALEGADSRFVNVFVKAIGFLVRLGFQDDSGSFRFWSAEAHTFVKVRVSRRQWLLPILIYRGSSFYLLAVTGCMDPKVGVPLFLIVLFYHDIFSGKLEEIDFNDILLKLLRMLPSVVSHLAMIPLVVQTILPMLQKDANPVLYAAALRLLCKTWEINDHVFGSLQGLLLPEAFTLCKYERSICISTAVTIRDACQKILTGV